MSQDNDYGRDRLYFGNWDMHITPAWLPDGKELLLVSNHGVPLGSGNVIRVPAEALGMTKAKAVLEEQTLYRTRPDVSIDGKRFVYSSTGGAADQFSNLYVQPTASGEPYKMTFFQHDAFHPRWSPDGEWIAYVSNQGGLPQLALLETYGGEKRTVRITDRRFKRPMGILSVRTVDAATGALTGSRIHLTASDGKFYAPSDAYARASGEGDPLFHHSGEFRVEVPVGKLSLSVVKGFEYQPAREEVEIRSGEVSRVTVSLAPIADMAAKGWYSGSTHVHMNYAGNLQNTLENLMMMSEAEDQDIVNEQIANKDNRILDYQFFVPGGGAHPLSTPERVLVVGQEYRPPFYGHVFMFGMRDHLISPFVTGYEGTAIESLYPSNTDMFRKAKAQGATVGYVHAFGGESDPLAGDLGGGKGYMVDAALGTTDGVEWSGAGRGSFFPWYATLNNGLRVTATGGEDSISNLHRSKLVGSVRTYVYTGARGLSMEAWFEGLRDGHAFVSTGPLVELTVNGRIPGRRGSDPERRRGRRRSARAQHHPARENRSRVQRPCPGRVSRRGRTNPLRSVEVVSRSRERLVSPSRGRQPQGPIPSRRVVRAGFHQSGLGERRRKTRAEPRGRGVFHPVDRQAAGDGRGLAGVALREREGARVRPVRGGAADLSRLPHAGDADVESGRRRPSSVAAFPPC